MKSLGQVVYERAISLLPTSHPVPGNRIKWAEWEELTPAERVRWRVIASHAVAEDARRRGTDPVVRVIRSLRAARDKIATIPGADDDPLLAEIDAVLAGVADVR